MTYINPIKLDKYNRVQRKDIFLDTPIFIYLLCFYYGVEEDSEDWDNSSYNSVKSLWKLVSSDTYIDNIHTYITLDYLNEVVGEIQKALWIAEFESLPFFNDLGSTRNTLYNYFVYMRDNSLLDPLENIKTFGDFLRSFGFKVNNPNNPTFSSATLSHLLEIAEELGVKVEKRHQDDNFKSAFLKISRP